MRFMKLAIQKEVAVLLLLGAFGIAIAVVSSLSQPAGKVVFLVENEVVSAKEDGSDVKALTKDKVKKGQPSWSPDGARISYLIAGNLTSSPKTHANIVIISAEGEQQRTVPVLATEQDGTMVGGLRFVEESGWYGNNAVFAAGSANPHISEYRVLDLKSAKVLESYFGTGFATCAAKEQVAYVSESSGGRTPGVSIEVNGKPIFTAGDVSIRSLRWSRKCDRLAFFEGEGANMRFLVLHGAQVEVNLPWQGIGAEGAVISPSGSSFLLTSESSVAMYDVATRSLLTESPAIEQTKKQNTSRAELLRKLGGQSADWWEQDPQ